MENKFLVIGSNSFSGAHFVNRLLKGDNKVVGVSRSEQPENVFLPYKWREDQQNFVFKVIDLNHQLDELIQLIHEFKPSYVVNFAAQGMVAQSWLYPEQWYQTNLVAQVEFHNQLRKCDFLKKYVHVTTPEAYGSTEGWQKEHFNFAPSTPYAVSRAACDLHLMSFLKAYKFPVVFTRAANVYGPGQQLYRIIPRTMLFARLGIKLPLHGGGHSIRSFIHIEDVVEATYNIALDGVPGDTYHISTKNSDSIRNVVEQICTLMKLKFTDVVDVADERLGKDQAYLLESSHLRDTLGWKDNIILEQGLNDTLQWIDNNLDILKTLPNNYIHKA